MNKKRDVNSNEITIQFGTGHTPYKTSKTVENGPMIQGARSKVSGMLQSITCMEEYESKSLEELHLGDYRARRKGLTASHLKENGKLADAAAAPLCPCSRACTTTNVLPSAPNKSTYVPKPNQSVQVTPDPSQAECCHQNVKCHRTVH